MSDLRTAEPPAGGSRLGLSARIAAYYGALFMGVGVHMPFMPLFFESRGLDAVDIGLVLGFGQWVRVVANPLAAHIADRRRERKRTILVLTFGTILAVALYGPAEGFPAVAAVALLVAVFFSPVIPLGDNLTMLTAYARGLDYGRLRLWGSITFIASSYAGGLLFVGRDPDLIWLALLGCVALTFAAAFTLPDTRPPPAPSSEHNLWRLLRHPIFLLFLVTMGLNMASHAVLYGFATLHWRSAGLGGGAIGWLWAEGTIVEVAVFALSARMLARFGPAGMIGLGAAAGALRWLVTGLSTDLWLLVPAQALHGFTFAAAYVGAMHFLTRAAPPALSATAQSLFAALAGGAALGLGLPAAGWLYEAYAGAAFHAMAVLSLFAVAGAALLARRWDGEVLRL